MMYNSLQTHTHTFSTGRREITFSGGRWLLASSGRPADSWTSHHRKSSTFASPPPPSEVENYPKGVGLGTLSRFVESCKMWHTHTHTPEKVEQNHPQEDVYFQWARKVGRSVPGISRNPEEEEEEQFRGSSFVLCICLALGESFSSIDFRCSAWCCCSVTHWYATCWKFVQSCASQDRVFTLIVSLYLFVKQLSFFFFACARLIFVLLLRREVEYCRLFYCCVRKK